MSITTKFIKMKLQCRSHTGGKGSQIEISYNIFPILYGVN